MKEEILKVKEEIQNYIKESKQADNYYKWLDSKSKNNRKN